VFAVQASQPVRPLIVSHPRRRGDPVPAKPGSASRRIRLENRQGKSMTLTSRKLRLRNRDIRLAPVAASLPDKATNCVFANVLSISFSRKENKHA
jgi:hypothetical protein